MREISPKKVNIDELAMKVFLKTLEIAGGPRKLIELRNLTWVPSLLSASYAIVLHEEEKKTSDEIASFLGIGKQSVRNMLRADVEAVKKRLSEGFSENEKIETHVAGALAKLAYEEIKKEMGDTL
ncbi:MAG: regulatory domain protein [Dictyoglomus sp. NZ13-RE01]|nr:MAG: regulatory domain protein [Dictyoglomus sp. NZ13-RE01]